MLRKFHQNIRSITHEPNVNFIHEKVNDIKPHIVLLTETLKTKDHPHTDDLETDLLSFTRNFHTFKNPDKHFQGISIFSRLSSNEITYSRPADDLEILKADVNFFNKKTKIFYGYLSPSIKCKNKILRFFEEMVKMFNEGNENILKEAIGDFNAKDTRLFPTKSPNFAGKMLADILEQQDNIAPSLKLKSKIFTI